VTTMNKAELVAAVAAATGLKRIQAHRAVDALFDVEGGILADAIDAGEKVLIPGFGTWQAAIRPARKGASPIDKRPMDIGAKRVVRFKPGKTLADRLAPL
jgi:DNA-binding protein HU-beta